MRRVVCGTLSVLVAGSLCCVAAAQEAGQSGKRFGVRIGVNSKPISSDLFGIFFEDINYSVDGGLYAELVQNRSFEYNMLSNQGWNHLSFWDHVARNEGRGRFRVDGGIPVHPNNPHYVILEVDEPGGGVGLSNGGFGGIVVREGESYEVSFWARQVYIERRWGGSSDLESQPMPVTVRLEGEKGEVLGEQRFEVKGIPWRKLEGSITASGSSAAARLVLLAHGKGGIGLDEISLFPRQTFKGRKNGLRADLAQVLADLKPRFVRFPGGCLVHGNGLSNMYRWKDTVGPVEQRRHNSNIWGYHQSMGLGYFEYFQFCEDIGAKPLPIVPAGVCCQNAGGMSYLGQRPIPMEEMGAYVQEVLDLVEWANGPADSRWGAVRAAAGHPEPFGLEYLGVGNEEHITEDFKVRFQMIFEALKAKHPEIKVVGTAGPFPDGEDFERGWAQGRELGVPIMDEHYYRAPGWFLQNQGRYDSYDRKGPAVYVGEYAAHERNRANTLFSALCEAAYMTTLERNGDVVRLASYAPLLAKQGHTQWRPDLIYFDNQVVTPSVNYYVQQLFSNYAGESYLSVDYVGGAGVEGVALSAVREAATGRVFVRLVNTTDQAVEGKVELAKPGAVAAQGEVLVLQGRPEDVNHFEREAALKPVAAPLAVGQEFVYTLPPFSLSVVVLEVGKD